MRPTIGAGSLEATRLIVNTCDVRLVVVHLRSDPQERRGTETILKQGRAILNMEACGGSTSQRTRGRIGLSFSEIEARLARRRPAIPAIAPAPSPTSSGEVKDTMA